MGNKLSYPETDLSGKVALITGGNTGIGYETAKGLARLGAHTFIACRSKDRAEAAIERIKRELSQSEGEASAAAKPNPDEQNKETSKDPKDSQNTEQSEAQKDSEEAAEPPKEVEGQNEAEEVRSKEPSTEQKDGEMTKVKIEYLPLDLASFASTKECARLFKERNLPLHILVNNAAILGPLFFQTGDGLEGQFQINHLGPVLLTLDLLPTLLDTAASSKDGRILFVTSSGHFLAESFSVELFNKTEENYKRLRDYNNTKLYNVMSGYCLQRRLQGKNITLSSIHPGYVRTEIGRSFSDSKVLVALHKMGSTVVARDAAKGAATSLNSAVNPELNSQQHFYYDSCRPKTPSADSRNEVFQEQLWEKTFEFLKDQLSQETYETYGPKPKEESSQQAAAVAEATEPAAAEESKEPAKPSETEETTKTSEENAEKEKPEDVEETTKSSTEGTSGVPPPSSSEANEGPAESAENQDSTVPPDEDIDDATKTE